jgi:hypothetical protein
LHKTPSGLSVRRVWLTAGGGCSIQDTTAVQMARCGSDLVLTSRPPLARPLYRKRSRLCSLQVMS